MCHAEGPDWGGEVGADTGLGGIEADALADEGGRGGGGAGGTPDCVGHLETDCGRGGGWCFARARGSGGGERGVKRGGRVVATHVEALHLGRWVGVVDWEKWCLCLSRGTTHV